MLMTQNGLEPAFRMAAWATSDDASMSNFGNATFGKRSSSSCDRFRFAMVLVSCTYFHVT